MLTILKGTIAGSVFAVATLSGVALAQSQRESDEAARTQSDDAVGSETMQTTATTEDREFPWGLLGLLGLAGLTGLKRRDRDVRTPQSGHAIPAR